MALPANWRAVNSLYTLRDQINARFPGRSTASDGIPADPRHKPDSDHYPHYVTALGPRPVVTAIDITHDPAHLLVIQDLADALLRSRDPRIKYVIANRHIASNHRVTTLMRTYEAWEWRPYEEEDPHENHMHLSVVDGAIADSRTMWAIWPVGRQPMFLVKRTTTADVWLATGAGRTGPIDEPTFNRLRAVGFPFYIVDPQDFDLVTIGCAVQVSQDAVEDAVDGVMTRVGFTVRPRI